MVVVEVVEHVVHVAVLERHRRRRRRPRGTAVAAALATAALAAATALAGLRLVAGPDALHRDAPRPPTATAALAAAATSLLLLATAATTTATTTAATAAAAASTARRHREVEHGDRREVLERRVGVPRDGLLARAERHARLVAQRPAARLVRLEQVDQRQVVLARAALHPLRAEQLRRLLRQVRVELADDCGARQAAARLPVATTAAVPAVSAAPRAPRVRKDAQAEVLVRDAGHAHENAPHDRRHGRRAALGRAEHNVVVEVAVDSQPTERGLHSLPQRRRERRWLVHEAAVAASHARVELLVPWLEHRRRGGGGALEERRRHAGAGRCGADVVEPRLLVRRVRLGLRVARLRALAVAAATALAAAIALALALALAAAASALAAAVAGAAATTA